MKNTNRSKKSLIILRILIFVLTLLVIVLIFSLIAQIFIMPKLKAKATELIIEQYIGDNEQAQAIINQMSDDDVEYIENLVEDIISPSEIPKLTEYAKNQDIDALKNYANQSLSDYDKEKLQSLYEKYKDSVPK